MKKFTIALIKVVIITNILYAHNYRPLVREGVKWHCRMNVVSLTTEPKAFPYIIEISGDTIINDISYKKCYYIYEDKNIATNEIPRAFLREDINEKKVYARYNYNYSTSLPLVVLYGYSDQNAEELLYDFNNLANTAQEWHKYINYSNEDTLTTDTIILNFKEYTKTTINDIYTFIESIGFVNQKFSDLEGDLLTPIIPRISSGFSTEALPIFCSFEDETGEVMSIPELTTINNSTRSNNILIKLYNKNIIITSTQLITSVNLISMTGVQVSIHEPNSNTITIPTNKYPSGCYIIHVSTNNDFVAKKIIL